MASLKTKDLEKRISGLEYKIEEYRRKERRQHQFLEATNAAIWEWDIIADSTEWKEGVYKLFGYQIHGPTPLDWWLKKIHPDDVQRILSSVADVIQSREQTWVGEYRFLRGDGSYAWVLDRAYVERDQHGKALAMLGAMLDITERKQAEEALRRSEERLRRLRDSNVIGIVTADRGKIYEANDAFLSMLGYSQEDVAAGRLGLFPIVAPEYHDEIERSLRELQETGLMRPHEKECVRIDGTRIPVMVGGALSETSPPCAILFVVDLSELKYLEARLRDAQKWETIGVLAGGMAHDFNNLLTTITGNTAIACDSLGAGHPARRYLADVLRASEKAAKLTAQLVAYAGKGRVVLEVTNLSSLVRRLGDQIRAAVPPQIDLSFELSADVPGINADAGQIEQVVATLIINAVEAIGSDAGRIIIRTRVENITESGRQQICIIGSPAPGAYVVLEIEDTGHGMTAETIARMFDPFYTTKFTGRGLGLAAVSGIVRTHKGGIQVTSTPQRGTLFRVFLPAA